MIIKKNGHTWELWVNLKFVMEGNILDIWNAALTYLPSNIDYIEINMEELK